MKNLRVENERLRDALLVQALALQMMQAAINRLNGSANESAWKQAIHFATCKARKMTEAEKREFQRIRGAEMREYFEMIALQDPNREGIIS